MLVYLKYMNNYCHCVINIQLNDILDILHLLRKKYVVMKANVLYRTKSYYNGSIQGTLYNWKVKNYHTLPAICMKN